MSVSPEDRDLIYALTLDNAVKYGGKPSKGAVIGKFLHLRPEYKPRVKEILPVIEEVVAEVAALGPERQAEELERYRHLLPERPARRAEEELPPLPGAERGRVVTRFAPNPDFVLHLGSVRPLLLSYMYARKYEGRFILRFEDTDPRTKRPRPEYYRMILEDLRWLGVEPDEMYYQSDRLELYYDVARELIRRGAAYVCTCSPEEFSALAREGRPCPHRNQSPGENMSMFDEMLAGGYGEGEAVLRIKTDLSHPNVSVRDWPALRIIDTGKYPHPRVGSRYRVWPLYNYSCAVDDHYMGVTHVIRGAEHLVNEEKQKYVYMHMGWEPPVAIHHGRVAIPDGVLSKSKILAGIRRGVYSGIDDPQLATLAALRRRGFRPEAIRRVVLRGGLKASLMTIDWSLLAAENRAIVDREANRYFGVREPVPAWFPCERELVARPRRHPSDPSRGEREIRVVPEEGRAEVYLERGDVGRLSPGAQVRLIALGNFRVAGVSGRGVELEYVDNDVERAKREGLPFLHWVPKSHSIRLELLYPGRSYAGVGEGNLLSESVDRVVQLERVGFFRVDSVSSGSVTLVYAHD
ncbi:glutamate--tRNA ligase [Candidatus Geothermarchaeota archaeon ex4572_27]|nr:MAG: glutamate--tRNA ligase [Candidatus Geothermarchaeota archaeon ex4572_27]